MGSGRNFSRRMIMLQESDPGYRADAGKRPAGFARLEIRGGKGVLTLYVQNLKYFEKGEWIYKGFLAQSDNSNHLINTGVLVIDKKGKGENVWRFDPGDVKDTGEGIDSFDVVGVTAQRKNSHKHDIYCPLIGYTGEEPKDWKEKIFHETHYGEESLQNDEAEIPEEVHTDDKPADEQMMGNPVAEETEEGGTDRKGERAEVETEEEKNETDRLKEMEQGYRQISEQLAGRKIENYIEDALKYYCKVQPFEHPIEGCNWWYINNYNYLFGIKYDDNKRIKYYIYGVPGGYREQMERQMDAWGFYNWHPARGKGKRPGVFGYWLAYVDANTGILVKPE